MVRLNSKVSTSRTEAGRAGEQCQYPNRDRNEEHKERHLTKFSKLKVTSKTENSRNSKPLRLTLQVQFEECGRLWKHSLAKHSTRINENQRGQLCFRIGLQCQWRRCLEIGLKKARNSKDRRENMAKHGYHLGVQTTISNRPLSSSRTVKSFKYSARHWIILLRHSIICASIKAQKSSADSTFKVCRIDILPYFSM